MRKLLSLLPVLLMVCGSSGLQFNTSTSVPPSVNINGQFAVVGFQDASGCHEETATKLFFACGLIFSDTISQNAGREKICTAYFDFRDCSGRLNCGNSTDFYAHSWHVASVLMREYDSYCRNFTPRLHFPPDVPGPPVPTIAPPPGPCKCDRDIYMEKYFVCGLMYVYNLRDAIYSNNPDYQKQACAIVSAYDTCVAMASTAACCDASQDIDVLASLSYLSDELRKAPGGNCKKYKRKNTSFRFRSSQSRCHLREYVGSYFTCGSAFIKSTYPVEPSKDEKCRFYKDFLHCKDLLVVCRTASDVTPALDYFTLILTEGYPNLCKGYNHSETCEKLTLLKNFFECGVTYYQSYNEFGTAYKDDPVQLCKLSGDFLNCTQVRVLSNDCKMMDEMFRHIKLVRKYVIHLFNEKQLSGCNNPDDHLKRIYMNLKRQTMCNQLNAVKKLVLCGVTFHKLLTSIEGNTSLVRNYSNICPLVEELMYCLYAATHDSGCSDEMILNWEVTVLKNHFLKLLEYNCTTLPPVDGTGFRQRRQVCEMKELTHKWESCDSTLGDGIWPYYQNSSEPTWEASFSKPVESQICNGLIQHRKCLYDSANNHHCSALTSEIKNISKELFKRLHLKYCSGSCSVAPSLLVLFYVTALVACSPRGGNKRPRAI